MGRKNTNGAKAEAPLFLDEAIKESTAGILGVLKDIATSLRSIVAEKKKHTKLLAKISEDLTNISTDIEEIKVDL